MKNQNFSNNLNVMAKAISEKEKENPSEGEGQGSQGGKPAVVKDDGKKSENVGGEGNPVDKLNDETVLSYIKQKKPELEVTSIDDLFKEKVIEKERDYKSEFSKKFDEFTEETKGAGTIDDFMFLQEDVDKLSEDDLVREILQVENPDFDEEDIADLIESEYTVDEEYADEKEVKKKKRILKRKVSEAKKYLKEKQEKFKVDMKEKTPVDEKSLLENIQKKNQEQFESFTKEWRTSLTESTKDFDGIEVKVNDDFKIKISADDKEKKESFDIVADASFTKFVDMFRNEDGSVKQKELHDAIYRVKNFDKIAGIIAKQAMEFGKEQQLRERVNPNEGFDQFANIDSSKLSKEDAFRLQMVKKAHYKSY